MWLYLAFDTTFSLEIYFKDSFAKMFQDLFTRLFVAVALVTIQMQKRSLVSDRLYNLQRIRNITVSFPVILSSKCSGKTIGKVYSYV